LRAHVQEATEYIDHVIGVDGGENKVSGKRRLNRDLRGFRVADFTHHDLVRVVTQDGTQSAGESEALFLVHRNLRDAVDLVFHRIFNCDDLVFVGLDFIQCGVERGGFAAASWSSHQHHAVGFKDVAAELAQIFFVKTHHVQYQVAKL